MPFSPSPEPSKPLPKTGSVSKFTPTVEKIDTARFFNLGSFENRSEVSESFISERETNQFDCSMGPSEL
jgi:hypothetical protein